MMTRNKQSGEPGQGQILQSGRVIFFTRVRAFSRRAGLTANTAEHIVRVPADDRASSISQSGTGTETIGQEVRLVCRSVGFAR